MTNTCWILTEEYNDYDQHGTYFVDVFQDKPTLEQILDATATACMTVRDQLRHCLHIQNGGGRRDTEDHWYVLTELQMK